MKICRLSLHTNHDDDGSIITNGSAFRGCGDSAAEASERQDSITDEIIGPLGQTKSRRISTVSNASNSSRASLRFNVHRDVGEIQPDLYLKKEPVLRQQSSAEGVEAGKTHLVLSYDWKTSDFVVKVLEITDLVAQSATGVCDPYLRVNLKPPVDKKIRTSTHQKRTLNPTFKETFKFPIPFDDLWEHKVVVEILDHSRVGWQHHPLGETIVDLEDLDVSSSLEMWAPVEKNAEAANIGEILFTLSYLKRAEQLTVTILKAKSLKKMDITGSADPYVKACLMLNGKVSKKRKTSVVHQSIDPVWNQALTFNVNESLLRKASLDLLVYDKDIIGGSEVIGIVSLGTQAVTLAGRRHWKDMIEDDSPVPMWHKISVLSEERGPDSG